jgi:hypothetical protein
MEIYFDINNNANQYATELPDMNTEYNDIIHIYYNIDDISRINIKNVINIPRETAKIVNCIDFITLGYL